jgi:hypothetical protein
MSEARTGNTAHIVRIWGGIASALASSIVAIVFTLRAGA